MARRAPGNSPFSTSRKEPDIPGVRERSKSEQNLLQMIRDKG